MDKIKIVLSYLAYPFTMANYFRRALERRTDVELLTVGSFTGQFIPWKNGMEIPYKYRNQVDYPLPSNMLHPSWEQVAPMLPWKPDLSLTVDAGWWYSSKPQCLSAHVATDPHCISGDSLLATGQGILYAYEASLSTEEIANKNGQGACEGVVYKGCIPTRKLTLETGQILKCTDDHLVETKDGFVESRELKVGDSLLMSRGTYYPEPGTDRDYSQGFILGAFQGDGSFGSSDMIKFTIAKHEKEGFGRKIKEHLFFGFDIDVVTDGKHYTSDNARVLQVRRWGLHSFLKSMDLKSGKVPLFVRQRSKKFIGGYIAGLLASDGCSVDGILQFTSKDEQLVRELQIILFYFGIISRIKYHISGLSAFKPGSRYWDLYISAGNSHRYLYDLTGEIPGRPIRVDSRRRDTDEGVYQNVMIVDIEGAVRNNPNSRVGEPVYDVINSETNSFLANGISVHNCLNYDKQRTLTDYFFNMQSSYMQTGDILLPYAYDKACHHPEPTIKKEYDCCMVGLHYPQRDEWVRRLTASGITVNYRIGDIYDEYRQENNKASIGLIWSSAQDVIARVFEVMAMGLVPVMNRLPGLDYLGFQEGKHYLGFSSMEEAVSQVQWAIANKELAQQISANAMNFVNERQMTWDFRLEQILHDTHIL